LHQALRKAGPMTLADIDLIGYTRGPGLIGGLIVSTVFGKTLASVLRIPTVAVNHLEGHLFSTMLEGDVALPCLTLLVTGGHSQLVLIRGVNDYHNLGGTVDDAVGEAFDKVARMLGLGYPGGPPVEAAARRGNPRAFDFPRPMISDQSCNFSCSGLKTAVKLAVDRLELDAQVIADVCASFQASITEVLIAKLRYALRSVEARTLAIVGGVAANRHIFGAIEKAFGGEYPIHCPPREFCSDNAAMIAMAAYKKLRRGYYSGVTVVPDPCLRLGDGSWD
jgi:N6-L-threonylcarbamoyladenine synthase